MLDSVHVTFQHASSIYGVSAHILDLSPEQCTMLRRALPPIAALFSLVHAIQLFLQPYKERYQAARDGLKGWWRVRAERLLFTACLDASAACIIRTFS